MGKKLFVGNLSFDTTSERPERALLAAGTCESASVITDRATGQVTWLRLRRDELVRGGRARQSTELNGQELEGRKLTVSEARERSGAGAAAVAAVVAGRGGTAAAVRRALLTATRAD